MCIDIRVKLNLPPLLCQRDSSELHHAFSKAHLQRCEIRWQVYFNSSVFQNPQALTRVCSPLGSMQTIARIICYIQSRAYQVRGCKH